MAGPWGEEVSIVSSKFGKWESENREGNNGRYGGEKESKTLDSWEAPKGGAQTHLQKKMGGNHPYRGKAKPSQELRLESIFNQGEEGNWVLFYKFTSRN